MYARAIKLAYHSVSTLKYAQCYQLLELEKDCMLVKYTEQTSRNDRGKESSKCSTFIAPKRAAVSGYFHSIFSLFYRTSTWSNVVLINRASYR